jgi:hypothetical protein
MQVVPPPTGGMPAEGRRKPLPDLPSEQHPLAHHDMLLAPLTLMRHQLRQGLIDLRFVANAEPRLLTQKDAIQSWDIFRGELVHERCSKAYQLPPVSAYDQRRPHSAEPLSCSQLCLPLGNFKSFDTLDIGRVIRTPQLINSDVKLVPQTMHQHSAQLISSQVMCVAKPEGVETGVDAVHYFFSHDHGQGRASTFIYCNFAKRDADKYCPYDLIAVKPQDADPEHFVVSATGVCHICPGTQGNTVTPLHTWIREEGQFSALQQLQYFQKFAMAKGWLIWKVGHRRGKFERRAEAMKLQHPLLNEWFGPSMQHIGSLVCYYCCGCCCCMYMLHVFCVIFDVENARADSIISAAI